MIAVYSVTVLVGGHSYLYLNSLYPALFGRMFISYPSFTIKPCRLLKLNHKEKREEGLSPICPYSYSWPKLLFHRACCRCIVIKQCFADSKADEANMGPFWGRQDPDERLVGPMNYAIWVGPLQPPLKPLPLRYTVTTLRVYTYFAVVGRSRLFFDKWSSFIMDDNNCQNPLALWLVALMV